MRSSDVCSRAGAGASAQAASASGTSTSAADRPRTLATQDRRAAVWSILDAARISGRIGDLEHHDRSRTAGLSEYDDELRHLVADLELSPLELELRTRGMWATRAQRDRRRARRARRGPVRLHRLDTPRREWNPNRSALFWLLVAVALIVVVLLAPML